MKGRFLLMLGTFAMAACCFAAPAGAAAPQVNATWVESVTTGSADLHARLDSGGLASLYHFEYIAEAAYLANEQGGRDVFFGGASVPQSGGNPGKEADNGVAQRITGLQWETRYRYRVVISNSGGTAVGPERVFTTKGTEGPLALLDRRGWEMVSPADKNGGEVQVPGAGGVFQAAAQGGAVTFGSAASFGTDAGGAPAGSEYVARRGPAGWAVENVTAPQAAGAFGEEPAGVPYQLFSAELSLGLLAAPDYPPLPGTAAPPGYANYYLRDAAGAYAALLTYGDIADLTLPPQSFELSFAGASPDLAHVVLSSCAALTGDATEVPGSGSGCDPEAPNLYMRSAAGWRLLNVLPGHSTSTPPARLAAPAGAVSADGSRVFWTDGADLFLSRESAGSVQVDGDPIVGGGGTFQAAAADGSVAYFTKGGVLYRYDVATAATVNLTPGGGVIGVLGASTDGSTVYYATTSGAFVNRGGTIIGPFASAVDLSSFPPSTGTGRVSADGATLAFLSSAELTAYDNTETTATGPGKPVSEVYVYRVGANKPICVSCNPTGERPQGPSMIPGAVANGPGATRAYKPRALSDDGNRLFFDTRDALVPRADTNGQPDVYEWEANGSGSCARAPGCLQLISSGSSRSASFVDASADGEDVFFLTANSLVGSDPGSVDLYDAREGGGFAEAPTPFVCEEDACQPLPPPPDDPTPGSLVPAPGNPPVHFPKARKAKPKRKHRAHRRQRSGRHHGRPGARR